MINMKELMESCGDTDDRHVIVNADSYDHYVKEECDGVDPFPVKELVFVPEDRMWK